MKLAESLLATWILAAELKDTAALSDSTMLWHYIDTPSISWRENSLKGLEGAGTSKYHLHVFFVCSTGKDVILHQVHVSIEQ
jgi:hypothetical protein